MSILDLGKVSFIELFQSRGSIIATTPPLSSYIHGSENQHGLQTSSFTTACISLHPARLLQQCSLVHSAKVMERDTQRQELNEVKVGLEEEIIEKEHVEKRLANLAAQIRFFNHLLTTVSQ